MGRPFSLPHLCRVEDTKRREPGKKRLLHSCLLLGLPGGTSPSSMLCLIHAYLFNKERHEAVKGEA